MKRYSVCMDEVVVDRIDKYCAEHNMSRSKLLTLASTEWITAQEAAPALRADLERQINELAKLVNDKFKDFEQK